MIKAARSPIEIATDLCFDTSETLKPTEDMEPRYAY